MFKPRHYAPSANQAPKMECDVNSNTIGARTYTPDRLYTFPIPRGVETIFNEYVCDLVLAGPNPDISYMFAIYEQVGVTLGNNSYNLVPNTTVTVLNQMTSFQTTALGATLSLPPGHYHIAFAFDDNAATLVTSPNAHQQHTWITGPWIYEDLGTFTFPATLTPSGYTQLTANEVPFWCALNYNGDTIP